MNVSAFRQALCDELTDDLGFAVVGGIREGRSEDRDIGYVWVERVQENGSDVNVQLDVLGVRVFKQWKAQEGTHRDVTALEDTMEAVQASLKDVQSQLAGTWYFRVTEVVPNYADMYVTATVEAFEDNPFSTGG